MRAPRGREQRAKLPQVPRVSDFGTLLGWFAGAYLGAGWLPVPVRVEWEGPHKALSFAPGFSWRHLAERGPQGGELLEVVCAAAQEWPQPPNGLALVLGPAHLVLDLDGPRAAEVVASVELPAGPRCRTPRGGEHLHFRIPPEVGAEGTVRPGGGLEFLTGMQLCLVPPTAGYAWSAWPSGPLPELPAALRAMLELARRGGSLVQPRPSPRRAGAGEAPAAPGRGDFAAWERVLAEAGVSVKWDGRGLLALCPLHVEERPSFHVRRMERTGQLRARCFGCDWSGSLRQLRRALRAGDTRLYRAAAEAIVSLGEELDDDTRRALLILTGELQKRELDPREPFGWSYREIAAATGCEPLLFPPNGPRDQHGRAVGVLAYRGKGVRRLLAKLARVGVDVKIGRPRTAGQQGRRSELTLPPNWFALSLSEQRGKPQEEAHLEDSSDVGRLQGKQGEGQTECVGGSPAVSVAPDREALLTRLKEALPEAKQH